MKKNNYYLTANEIDLANLIKKFWKEKILILSLSILSCLAIYLYVFFQPQVFKAEVTTKNPPTNLFNSYSYSILNLSRAESGFYEEYLSIIHLNILSRENLDKFLQQNTEFDNFKVFLKSKNITAKQYFANDKFGEVKEKNKTVPNKYFIIFGKELDGIKFINSYVEFSKKNSDIEIKKNIKDAIDLNIKIHEEALEIAKLIGQEKPLEQQATHHTAPLPAIDKFLTYKNDQVTSQISLSYKGTQVISKNIFNLKTLLLKLENDQFNYNYIFDKASNHINISRSSSSYYLVGLFFGLLLSFIIIFFKSFLKNTQ
jgi:LPS O-antigen subunit length determinant protein (WzzB/FepE family)